MYDVLIIGAGISGLSAAIYAAERKLSVLLLTKGYRPDGSTNYAQGGIATVTSKEDSFEYHIEDTILAGAGLCKKNRVRILAHNGPQTIEQLIKWGVRFTTNPSQKKSKHFDLHLEGGHSHKRILHSADLTGKEMMRALLLEIKKHKNIHFLENSSIHELIVQDNPKRCIGAQIIHQKTGVLSSIYAKTTIIATGGAGRLWLHSTNPVDSTGDGMAVAARAGVALQDIEFMQFHPTSLHAPQLKKTFLISEAVRGFGGILKNKKGLPFMDTVHPLGSLAPRDIVAREIHKEMEKTKESNMYLDCTHKSEKDLQKQFPNIFAKCLEIGIDMSKDWVPVVPAAHYMCGGILVNSESKTEIDGLYACGEVAATGVHGANRLASNSLLESVVFAIRAIQNIIKTKQNEITFSVPQTTPQTVNLSESKYWKEKKITLQTIMWDYCGIVRNTQKLKTGLQKISDLEVDIDKYLSKNEVPNIHFLSFRNAVQNSKMIFQSALKRRESRGLHYTLDYPHKNKHPKRNRIYLNS